MHTLLLTIVNIDSDTSHVESIPVNDGVDVDAAIKRHGGYLVDDAVFTIDDDNAVTYHATIAI